MKEKIKCFYPLIIVISLLGCIKDVPPNIPIVVQGIVIDTVKNKPLTHVKVLVNGCGQTLMAGVICDDLIDSTRTDSEGKFELTFKTEGKSIWYEAQVEEYIGNTDYSTRERIKAGEDNTNLILKARELGIVEVILKVKQNPLVSYPANPLIVASTYSVHYLYQPQIDTVLPVKVLPNAFNYLRFSIGDSSIGKTRQVNDSIYIDLSDKIQFTKTIENTKELPGK